MSEIKTFSKPPSYPRKYQGVSKLRTQGVSDAALREEVDEYFHAGARVKPGDIVVDIGANVGAFALAVAELVDGDVTIHCFEPAVPTFDLLQRNFRENPLLRKSKHTLNLVALTRPEEAGTEREFYFFKRLPTDSTYDLVGKRRDFETFFYQHAARIDATFRKVPVLGRPVGRVVRSTIEYVCARDNRFGVWLADKVTGLTVMVCKLETLESWMRDHHVPRIDLMKIDVEGAEMHVLEGVQGAWPLIQQVAIETHDHDGRRQRIVDLLRAQGFSSIESFRPQIAERNAMDLVLITASRSKA